MFVVALTVEPLSAGVERLIVLLLVVLPLFAGVVRLLTLAFEVVTALERFGLSAMVVSPLVGRSFTTELRLVVVDTGSTVVLLTVPDVLTLFLAALLIV